MAVFFGVMFMAEQVDIRRLLVLKGPALEAGGVFDFLHEHFDVHVAENLEQALATVRNERFDAVMAQTSDFLPLERGIVTQQAAAVMDTIGDGVCIVDGEGSMVWSNQRFDKFPKPLLDSLLEQCKEAYRQFASAQDPEIERGKRFTLMPDERTYYEIICSPVRDGKGRLSNVAAVVVDATMQRRQQMKLNAIDRAGRELVCLDEGEDSTQDATKRLEFLSERIISCSRHVLDYQHFAILLLDERTNRLEMLVCQGLEAEAQKYDLFANTEENGICGYVAATGHGYICPDVSKDPLYFRGMSGAASSLTVPLRMHDKVVGVLNVESDRLEAFDEEDRQFAEIFANYVAIAMHILRLLTAERYTTHTEVSGSICAAVGSPLNDIITEAGQILEDYIGHDDLRKRLDGIIEHATGARDIVHKCAEAPASGVIPSAAGPEQKADPVLAGKSVLVADDEELIRRTVCDVLISCGCNVDFACDGIEAMEMVAQNSYDLVVSDIKMPGADGYEVFSAAKSAGISAVILITAFGYDPGHSIVKSNRDGLSAVLLKPFKVKQLLETCRNAVQKAAK